MDPAPCGTARSSVHYCLMPPPNTTAAAPTRHSGPPTPSGSAHLGDFTATRRLLPIAALSTLIGLFAAYLAAGLLKLISLFTNLFFFQRMSTASISPADHHLG